MYFKVLQTNFRQKDPSESEDALCGIALVEFKNLMGKAVSADLYLSACGAGEIAEGSQRKQLELPIQFGMLAQQLLP